LALILIAQALRAFYPAPMHPAFITSIVVGAVGLLASVGGLVWFIWKDFHAPSRAT
jgi:hypothetical protein